MGQWAWSTVRYFVNAELSQGLQYNWLTVISFYCVQ